MKTGSRIRSALKQRPRLRRVLIGAVALVVLYTVLGFIAAPIIARRVGERKLSELLHRKVTIQQVRINPYALSATVRGFRIRDRDGARDLLAFAELYVNVQLASVFKGGVIVKQLRLVKPVVGLVRLNAERYNFSDILDELSSGEPSSDEPSRFSLSNLELLDGRVALDDRSKSARHEVTGINIGIPFISNFPYQVETFVQPAFSATINGTPLVVKGRTKPFADSLESSIDINLEKVDLAHYLPYIPVKLKLKVRSGNLATKLRVSFIQHLDRLPRVDLSGRVALSALEVVDPRDRPLLKLPLLELLLASSDLLQSRVAVERVRVQSPVIHLRRGARGALQLQSLLAVDAPAGSEARAKQPAARPAAAPKDKAARPWAVQAKRLELAKARIVFADRSNPRPFKTVIHPLTVTVRNFSTAKGRRAAVAVEATTEAEERIGVKGQLGIAPLAFEGTVTAEGLRLPKYAPYYAEQILFNVGQGTFAAEVPLRLAAKGPDLEVKVTKLRAELRGLQLRKPGERHDFVQLPRLALRDTDLDLGRRELVVGGVAIERPQLRLERLGADRPWNLATLVPAGPEPGAGAPAPTRAPPGKAFGVLLRKLNLNEGAVRMEDRANGSAAVIDLRGIGLGVEGLGTQPGVRGRVSLRARVNRSGSLRTQGTLGLDPLQADVQLQLNKIPIVPFQPYFEQSVALLISSGHVSSKGRVALSSSPRDGPSVTYRGEVSAGDVVAIARGGAEELARVGTLRLSGIDAVTQPFKLSVAEVGVKDTSAQVVINPDQTLNLAAVAPPAGQRGGDAAPGPVAKETSAAPAADAAERAAPPPVRIGAVVLQGVAVSVTDRSIRPAFGTRLSELSGRVEGLSFIESERAKVDLKGRLADAPLTITGQINPLAKKRYIDLTLRLADLDLSSMTPYSGKYAGYGIEKGQLSLDLKYLIAARKLDSQNNVRIDQFDFGQAVESKDATNLPVRLAVALLKDRHGVIKLELPVSGSLDDPKFSVWRVLVMVLKNLLVKAATSPFALIGSLFGGGEQLSWLEFEPGLAEVRAAGRRKLDSLAKALFERPGLRLEVEGHADPASDRKALRRMAVERQVKAQKLKDLVAGGAEARDLDRVVVKRSERPKYLERAYRAAKIPNKPKNVLGMLKSLPPAEMERTTSIELVASSDLVNISSQLGIIEALQLFTTDLKTLDNRKLVIPNSSIFGHIIENLTHHPLRRVDVDVGVSYDADIDQTRQVLEALPPKIPGALADPPPQIFLRGLGASSVDWQLRVWCSTAAYWDVYQAAIRDIKKALEQADLAIPFPQMDVHFDAEIGKALRRTA